MKVGQVYIFADEHRDPFIFLVLAVIDNYHMSDADKIDRAGYSVLVLNGKFGVWPARLRHTPNLPYGWLDSRIDTVVTHRTGTTFDIARNSIIATDSVRFPAEE